ncbi:hypothetical protein MRX96_033684 [Rhipicephalus microplus]
MQRQTANLGRGRNAGQGTERSADDDLFGETQTLGRRRPTSAGPKIPPRRGSTWPQTRGNAPHGRGRSAVACNAEKKLPPYFRECIAGQYYSIK